MNNSTKRLSERHLINFLNKPGSFFFDYEKGTIVNFFDLRLALAIRRNQLRIHSTIISNYAFWK